MTLRIGWAVAFKSLSITNEETTHEETGAFAMKRTMLTRGVMLAALGLMGGVGLFGISVGVAQASMAVPPCAAGTESNAKAVCVPCPKGKYKDFDGVGACNTCPNGHICERPGTTRPEMCEVNTAARFDRTSCIDCSNGYYANPASQCTLSTDSMDSCCLKN
jgi:hypothetical protein